MWTARAVFGSKNVSEWPNQSLNIKTIENLYQILAADTLMIAIYSIRMNISYFPKKNGRKCLKKWKSHDLKRIRYFQPRARLIWIVLFS